MHRYVTATVKVEQSHRNSLPLQPQVLPGLSAQRTSPSEIGCALPYPQDWHRSAARGAARFQSTRSFLPIVAANVTAASSALPPISEGATLSR